MSAATALASVPLDPPADVMLQLETDANINSMQIVLVDGVLDGELLSRAARDIAPRFPILLAKPDLPSRRIVRGARTPDEIWCREVECDRPFTFDDFGFRQAIVDLSLRHPIRWRDAVPLRLWLLRSRRSHRSCLVVNTSHATADAKSDSLLVEALMHRYGVLLRDDPQGAPEPGESFGFGSLRRLSPGRRATLAAAGAGAALGEMVARDIGYPPSRRRGRVLDFHHEIVPDGLARSIRLLSRASGQTINTVFCAALARVIAQENGAGGAPEGKRVRLVSAVSVRPLAGPSAARDYRNFMVPCRIRVRSRPSGAEMLDEIGRQYRALKQGGLLRELSMLGLVAGLLRHGLSRRPMRGLIHLIQGTSACYSNPGVVDEDFRYFGVRSLPIAAYIGVGCVIAPLRFILYTPQVNGRIHLNGVYWRDLLGDFGCRVAMPLKAELARLCHEFQVDREET